MKKKYKTFKDLEWNKNISIFSYEPKERARIDFDNEYSISVIYGGGAYGDRENPYECAIWKNNKLCYDTNITDDVIGYCNEKKVTKIMKQIQKLKQVKEK